MTVRSLNRYEHGFILTLISIGLVYLPFSQSRAKDGPSAVPEGSGSIIQPASWQLTRKDQTATGEPVRAAIQQFEGAILVKNEKDLLVLSLPTAKLEDLHQKLSHFGMITGREASDGHQAPTTLLRLILQSSDQ